MTQHTITVCDWHGSEVERTDATEHYFHPPDSAEFVGHEYGLGHSDTVDICDDCLFDNNWLIESSLCGICGDRTGPYVDLKKSTGERFNRRVCLEHSPWELQES